ncbi:hypothetical protein HDU76_010472, partial [Blyttiomyces sp. JEL0837]
MATTPSNIQDIEDSPSTSPSRCANCTSSCKTTKKSHSNPSSTCQNRSNQQEPQNPAANVGQGTSGEHHPMAIHFPGRDGVNDVFDVVIIGAGVIGCSIARELSRYDLRVLVFEK